MKWLSRGLLVVVSIAAALLGVVAWRSQRTFDVPLPDIHANTDPAIIARGRYLVYGPATCAYCHVPREAWPVLDRGDLLPLTGNHVFRLPFGDFYSSNLTPDPDTGIGNRSDAQIARVLRTGVRSDGRAAFPFMSFHNLSDEDLIAIVSFLRSRQPVRKDVPPHRLSLLGRAIMAFAIEPVAADSPPASSSPVGPSIERGDYLANHVSACAECHTDRNPRSGALEGARFAGGQRMDLAADPNRVAVPPNLTPDPRTSPIGRWSEEAFVARFRRGETVTGTPMPWGGYARMTEDDLRSVYRYLRSLPPVEHATGPVMQDKKD